MAFRCLLCHPTVHNSKDKGNMKAHLGSTTIPYHNMGPFSCQVLNCTARHPRGDAVQNHGNHQSLWARDQALVDALADLAGECQLPWGPGVFPAAVPRPPPAAQLPPAAQVLPAAQLPPVAVVVPVPGAGAGAGAGPAGPARARVPARAPTPPAEVEALALDLNLEWLHEGNGDEVREVEEEPIPGYYYEFGVPYGTGPVIPGGR